MATGLHDLRVWREATAPAVSRATATPKDPSLWHRIRGASVSIPSNIAEGDERDTDKGPLAEPTTQPGIALEVELLPATAIEPLLPQAVVPGRRTGVLIGARTLLPLNP